MYALLLTCACEKDAWVTERRRAGEEMQLNEYAACFNLVLFFFFLENAICGGRCWFCGAPPQISLCGKRCFLKGGYDMSDPSVSQVVNIQHPKWMPSLWPWLKNTWQAGGGVVDHTGLPWHSSQTRLGTRELQAPSVSKPPWSIVDLTPEFSSCCVRLWFPSKTHFIHHYL